MNLVKSLWRWLDDRIGIVQSVEPIAKHPVPPNTGWWYVFGSATLFVFILQVVTGITLALGYVPSAAHAYDSLQFITNDALMGRILRGIHFMGASTMVVLIGVHMIRVFLMGSFKFPREMNWLAGVVLLFLTLAMAFTGEVLRWDQNAVWGLVVGVEQAGRAPLIGPLLGHFLLAGETVGGATLSRFFSYHVFFIPALLFGTIGLHLYLVIRHGISEPPQAGQPVEPQTYRSQYEELLAKKGKPFWPHAAWRDAVFGASVILVVIILGVVIGAPALVKPPDPSIVEAVPRPDWEFLWYFAVLALIPPVTEPFVMIGAPLLAGILLIGLPLIARGGERSPTRRPWAVGFVLVGVVMVASLTWIGVRAPWSPKFNAAPLPPEVVNSTDSQVIEGADLFHKKGCEYCHAIAGQGGERGPNLTFIGDRLTQDQMQVRILNGGHNMPAYGAILNPGEVDALVAFLQSRTASR